MNHDNIPINDVVGVFEKCIPKNYMPQLGKEYVFLNNECTYCTASMSSRLSQNGPGPAAGLHCDN